MLVRGLDLARGKRIEAHRTGLVGQRVRVERVEADLVALLGAVAVRRDDLADPLDHGRPVLGPHADGLAGVHPAAVLGHVGDRQLRVLGGVEALERHRHCGHEERAGIEVLEGAAQKRRAALGSAEDLDRLHGDDDEREAPAEVEVAGVGLDHVHRQVAGAATQLGEQLAVAVERGHLVPASGEVDRHPARSGAHVQHRSARLIREAAPQRQVRGVAAALHVVPDDRRRRGHSGAISDRACSTATALPT